MDTEKIIYASNTETSLKSDDDNIWIWMCLFDMTFFWYLNFYSRMHKSVAVKLFNDMYVVDYWRNPKRQAIFVWVLIL